MKRENFKYLATVDSDGRLRNGAWFNVCFLPDVASNQVVFDEFPETGTNGVSCKDYVWSGETLIYSPIEERSEET